MDSLQTILGDFHASAVFAGGVVGDDAGDGHVEGFGDVDVGGAVLQD